MRDSGKPLGTSHRHERRVVVASLVASLGVHAAVIGLLPPPAAPALETLAPISVTLRALPTDLRAGEDGASTRAEQPPPATAAPASKPVAEPAPTLVGSEAQPRRTQAGPRPPPIRATLPERRAPPAPLSPPARTAGAPSAERAPDEAAVPGDIPAAPAAERPATEPSRRAAAAPTSTQPPSFRAEHLSNPPPLYPRRARRAGVEGTVTLKVLVTATGAPGKVELDASSGSEALDQAAIDAVKRWQFVPARRGDAPVEAWVRVPVIFRLQSG